MLQPSDSLLPDAQPLKRPKSLDASRKLTALNLSPRHRVLLFAAFLTLQLTLLLSAFTTSPLRRPHLPAGGECSTGKVFVYDLPPFFNKELVDRCDELVVDELHEWGTGCGAVSNNGFGRISGADLAGIVPDSLLPSWFSTNQFAAELIFHNRLLSHRCRTLNSTEATAFYIPFYAGLAVGKHLWSPKSGERDRACEKLLRWIKQQDPWIRSNGRDHFIVLGRITWDFRRSREGGWGSSFIYMLGMEKVSRLVIEREQWDENDIGVPYPTGFHPRSASEVEEWQRFVLGRNRTALFSYAGAARPGFKDDFRGLLAEECARANGTCRAVDCGGGRCGNRSRETVRTFLDSKFCLQPRGDSFTRRSMFDCMVAGSIPVLFWRRSAYVQYGLYLPAGEEWSVFIDRKGVREGAVRVRRVLEGIEEGRVRRMREKVVEMIPRIVYGGAEDGIRGGVRDAFDVAFDGVLRRVREQRKASVMGNVTGDQRLG